ncbi:MAG: MliC family protein [Sphingopyxis sp.]|uniref:MliC family protein n=1 Tax=Sphingopyxis sp. TaxID=1908224 RepID=UPI001A5E673D|nr:MliC family protein [Sphingopyxis sp.]MBL9067956.1 MliC family protein [Sphingopyxis sp.]
MHRIKLAAPAAAALLLSACMSVGGPGVSTYYECDRGTRLKVDFMGDRALFSVNGGRAEAMRSAPAASGAMYENRAGWRLHTKGNEATWNTALRLAPESCRQVVVPR